jgi:hypothetical protein
MQTTATRTPAIFHNHQGENMKSKILLWFSVPELSARLLAAESTITTLKQFQQQQHSRIVQLEAQVARHDQQHLEHEDRAARTEVAVSKIGQPTRYVTDPVTGGLSEVR